MRSSRQSGSVFRQRRWNSELVIAESPELKGVDSPSAKFKSSYAKEVVQDIRQKRPGRLSHPGYVYHSRSELRFDEYFEPRDQLQRSFSNYDLSTGLSQRSVLIQAELPNKEDSVAWMTAKTFKRILDKQEAAEVGSGSCGSRRPPIKTEALLESQEERNDLLRNMIKMKAVLNLDVKEKRQWANVCSILEQRKASLPQVNGELDFQGENGLKEEFIKLKEQNELLNSEIHNLRMERNAEKHYENEIESLRCQLKTVESNKKTCESISSRLMSLLEHVSLVLESTSPKHKQLVDRTRSEMSELSRKSGDRLRPELKCISNRTSRSSLKKSPGSDKGRSTSMNQAQQLNYSSMNESRDSSLPNGRDSSGSVFAFPNPNKYYENIEVFESLLKDSYEEQGPMVHKENKNDTSQEPRRAKLGRQTSLKNSGALKNRGGNSSLVLDDSKNMGRQKTHKLMRSVKWLLAKDKTLGSSPYKK